MIKNFAAALIAGLASAQNGTSSVDAFSSIIYSDDRYQVTLNAWNGYDKTWNIYTELDVRAINVLPTAMINVCIDKPDSSAVDYDCMVVVLDNLDKGSDFKIALNDGRYSVSKGSETMTLENED